MDIKRINFLILTLVFMFVITGCSSDDDDDMTPEVDELENIVEVATENGNFTTLITALEATGLDATLSDETAEFTVFAPTDDAFALLGADTISALLADTAQLSNILTYHVLPGSISSTAAIDAAGTTVETVNGASLGLSLDGSNLLVNTSTVVTTDIETSNGIIHVIDAVLIPPAEMTSPDTNIIETAQAAGNFTTLIAALEQANLDTVLADETTQFTVFAPTDEAFAAIDENLLEAILADNDVLTAILLQHVVSGATVGSTDAYTLNGTNVTTASEAEINIAINSTTDMLMFGGANIVMKDIYTSNGVIHVIDAVVVGDVELPEPLLSIYDVANENGSFDTLVAALEATGLDDTLDDNSSTFTVFAPTDAAFALLGQETIQTLLDDPDTLRDILLYHVLSGSEVLQDAALTVAQSENNTITMANEDMAALSYTNSMLYINDAYVSTPNVMAENGVIHVIDQVIMPPEDMGTPTMNIAEVAASDDNFSTLVTALESANLVDALADETKTYTVFAPTNAAFDKIPDATLTSLLADTDALSSVLLQHVVEGVSINSIAAFAANGGAVDTMADNDVSVALINYASSSSSENDEVAYDAENQMLVGGQNSVHAGMTLYYYDGDLGSAGSECNDSCANNWPPVIVTDGAVSGIPGLGTVTRDDNTVQATFNGRPLYFYANDTEAGDTSGASVANWSLAEQTQISLQIQGANVVTKDIYTTNGIIHVIDTVITETLN